MCPRVKFSLEYEDKHGHHGVQHVRNVERGEFQIGTLRDFLRFAATPYISYTSNTSYVVRQHKSCCILA
ncbi:hypothetical protein KQX54_009907 [Cotesia glomerata]|uniref:Uncharacterized protein n=1 Tax=Cotesia glomerata TaxID=32391 RepID=A0AAV7I743_COTGL|nr:hypothetical protein KQX54_009907 [Cotesia glomerata]